MNGSLWGHDTLKACDVVAEPLSGTGRGTSAAGDALWGTGLLCEGTNSGGAEVVKGGGGEPSDTALVGFANGVGLLVHLSGGEAVGLVGVVPSLKDGLAVSGVHRVLEAAVGFASLLLGGVGAWLALVVKDTDGEPAITALERGGEFVGLGEPLDISAVSTDTVSGGVAALVSGVALLGCVGEGEGLHQVGLTGLGAEPVRGNLVSHSGGRGLLGHDGDDLTGDGHHLGTSEGAVGTVALLVGGCQLKWRHRGVGQGQGAGLGTPFEDGLDASHDGLDLHGEGREG